MTLRRVVRGLRDKIKFFIFKLGSKGKERFECPICGYSGPFMDIAPTTGLRKHAKCPSCNALERHRIQFLVLERLLGDRGEVVKGKMLHFAPEPFFRDYFSKRFAQYETADFCMEGVDYHVDIQQLPFADASYDFVFASHVLEHIPDDEKAIAEIRRILRPGGIAILPVPIVTDKTIEYAEPNPYETYHVRAPGLDYFERYERHFSRVEKIASQSLPEKYQLFVYEDWSHRPTKQSPLLPSIPGDKHADIVPVCYV